MASSCGDGCSHNCGEGSAPVDIEDYKCEIKALREQNAKLAQKISELRQPQSNRPTLPPGRKLRSEAWFNDPSDPAMNVLYMDRYLNYGLTPEELMSRRPIIGIAQSGSDLSPCNRHHLQTAKRVREGIRAAGGIALEFPTHPIQESSRRPTATLDRNLAYLTLVEILHSFPLDGVVLLTGCDKTTPACLMAAATVVRG